MSSISIWYRPEGNEPEKVDTARSQKQAQRLLYEYQMAFGCLPRQHRHGKDKLWAGRKDQEPEWTESELLYQKTHREEV